MEIGQVTEEALLLDPKIKNKKRGPKEASVRLLLQPIVVFFLYLLPFLSFFPNSILRYTFIRSCVCERERERDKANRINSSPFFFFCFGKLQNSERESEGWTNFLGVLALFFIPHCSSLSLSIFAGDTCSFPGGK